MVEGVSQAQLLLNRGIQLVEAPSQASKAEGRGVLLTAADLFRADGSYEKQGDALAQAAASYHPGQGASSLSVNPYCSTTTRRFFEVLSLVEKAVEAYGHSSSQSRVAERCLGAMDVAVDHFDLLDKRPGGAKPSAKKQIAKIYTKGAHYFEQLGDLVHSIRWFEAAEELRSDAGLPFDEELSSDEDEGTLDGTIEEAGSPSDQGLSPQKDGPTELGQVGNVLRMPRFKVDGGSEIAVSACLADPNQFAHLIELVMIWATEAEDRVEHFRTESKTRFIRKVPRVEYFLSQTGRGRPPSPSVDLEFWEEMYAHLHPVVLDCDSQQVRGTLTVAKAGLLRGVELGSEAERESVDKYTKAHTRLIRCHTLAQDGQKSLKGIQPYVESLEALLRPSAPSIHNVSQDKIETYNNLCFFLQSIIDTLPPLCRGLRTIWVTSLVFGTLNGTVGNTYRPAQQLNPELDQAGGVAFQRLLVQISDLLQRSMDAVLGPLPAALSELRLFLGPELLLGEGNNSDSSNESPLRNLRRLKKVVLDCRDACLSWQENYAQVKLELRRDKAHPEWEFGEGFEEKLFRQSSHNHDRCAEFVQILDWMLEEQTELANVAWGEVPMGEACPETPTQKLAVGMAAREVVLSIKAQRERFSGLDQHLSPLCEDHIDAWQSMMETVESSHHDILRRVRQLPLSGVGGKEFQRRTVK